MELGLAGRKALITGSTQGIGFAIASTLAQEGANVVLNGRFNESVDAAIAAILDVVPDAAVSGIVADASTEDGAAAISRHLPDTDILINNLGIFERRAFDLIDDSEWMRYFNVNVLSGVRLSRHYVPGMRARNWGRILFVASESGLNIPPDMIHYGMSKAAQIAVARGLAASLSGTGVTVNSLLPGPTRTPGVAASVARRAKEQSKTIDEIEADYFQMARPTSISRRFADPQEVANMAAYLCGAGASATTGSAVRVDGGIVMAF